MLLRFVPRVLSGVLLCFAVLVSGCSPTHTTTGAAGAATPSWVRGMTTIEESALPPEARQTLALIDKDGPFPYAKDGVVFGNFEKLLPAHERGYYHEYTVKTPGSRDRGARRIVTGRGGEVYYTDDHYESFRAVLR
ncbi:ribonuclease [Streptomyces sp. NPDC001982]|uniref:ribonuclease n=1 Tax=unclassified Streptomyces TaxID=2593676 RepID=UPI00331A7241